MIQLRRSQQRGFADHGWLQSYHTFSFGSFRDPEHSRFRALRVINEDRVAPQQGFGTHAHDNMEIVSYVLDGELEHKDSMGNGEVLRPGEFQRITAGTGITHSEFNPSATDPTHFYQIWLYPEQKGLEPGYEQRAFDPVERRDRFQCVASREGHDGALRIHQDARIYLADLTGTKSVHYPLQAGRHAWLQILRGSVDFHDHRLVAGDGVAISDESMLALSTNETAELLLFDLA